MADLLIEIGCEEIPARMIDAAREELARRVSDLVARERLGQPKMSAFSTPRRLAVMARGVAENQADVEEQVLGPSVKVAYKDGQPTPAAEAFSRKVGIDVARLQKVSTPKGEYLAATVTRRGRSAAEILQKDLPAEFSGIYWPKSMYWRGKNAERFIRPVRWLVAVLDDDVVPLEFAGASAGLNSAGHRTLGKSLKLKRAADYAESLKKTAKVIADPAERERVIRQALDEATRTVRGARWREDAQLLNTVVNLTEFPSAILGSFDPEFLQLPEEVLVTVMRDHQKYFAVEDNNGRLLPHFMAVLNTDGDPEGLIRHGHERVLRARFNDARFFWKTDQKIPLPQRVELLKHVTFQKDLGSYYDKTQRVVALADRLATDLLQKGIELDREALREAAQLAKSDLTTELVKEFTELQGIVGGLYARAQGHSTAVAAAIYDHYQPESMEDAVPRTIEGAVLSIADKADTIAGMFALGLQPSGSKDPFALRRQANGIVKVICEKKLPLPAFFEQLSVAATAWPSLKADFDQNIRGFFRERIEFYVRDVRGFEYDIVNAVVAAGYEDFSDTLRRAEAVATVRGSEDFEHISIAFKRIKNILRQAAETGKRVGDSVEEEQNKEEAERILYRRMSDSAQRFDHLRRQKKYTEALAELATLRPTIDNFFDRVMVMVEEERLRTNRLALLAAMLREFSTLADFSEIVTARESGVRSQ
jgi:glycyl-tRNA synthetase beta chain